MEELAHYMAQGAKLTPLFCSYLPIKTGRRLVSP